MKNYPRVTSVEVIGDLTVRVGFNDGVVLDHDLSHLVARGGIWAPLADPDYFAQVRVDADVDTIAWPNGADICPDILHGDYEFERSRA